MKSEAEAALQSLIQVLTECQSDFEADRELFFAKNVFKAGRFIRLYAQLMEKLNVMIGDDVADELEELDLHEQHSRFLSDWDSFLGLVEAEANISTSEPVDTLDFVNSKTDFVKIDQHKSQEKISIAQLHNRFKKKLDDQGDSFMLLVLLRHFAW